MTFGISLELAGQSTRERGRYEETSCGCLAALYQISFYSITHPSKLQSYPEISVTLDARAVRMALDVVPWVEQIKH